MIGMVADFHKCLYQFFFKNYKPFFGIVEKLYTQLNMTPTTTLAYEYESLVNILALSKVSNTEMRCLLSDIFTELWN